MDYLRPAPGMELLGCDVLRSIQRGQGYIWLGNQRFPLFFDFFSHFKTKRQTPKCIDVKMFNAVRS